MPAGVGACGRVILGGAGMYVKGYGVPYAGLAAR